MWLARWRGAASFVVQGGARWPMPMFQFACLCSPPPAVFAGCAGRRHGGLRLGGPGVRPALVFVLAGGAPPVPPYQHRAIAAQGHAYCGAARPGGPRRGGGGECVCVEVARGGPASLTMRGVRLVLFGLRLAWALPPWLVVAVCATPACSAAPYAQAVGRWGGGLCSCELPPSGSTRDAAGCVGSLPANVGTRALRPRAQCPFCSL